MLKRIFVRSSTSHVSINDFDEYAPRALAAMNQVQAVVQWVEARANPPWLDPNRVTPEMVNRLYSHWEETIADRSSTDELARSLRQLREREPAGRDLRDVHRRVLEVSEAALAFGILQRDLAAALIKEDGSFAAEIMAEQTKVGINMDRRFRALERAGKALAQHHPEMARQLGMIS